MKNETTSKEIQQKIARMRAGHQQPLSKEVKEKLDRIKGVLPPLPLSDYVRKRLERLKAL